jgi:hypothetical protein
MKNTKQIMKIKEVTIDGITYVVRSTTNAGLKRAIRDFKKSVKKNTKDNKDGI